MPNWTLNEFSLKWCKKRFGNTSRDNVNDRWFNKMTALQRHYNGKWWAHATQRDILPGLKCVIALCVFMWLHLYLCYCKYYLLFLIQCVITHRTLMKALQPTSKSNWRNLEYFVCFFLIFHFLEIHSPYKYIKTAIHGANTQHATEALRFAQAVSIWIRIMPLDWNKQKRTRSTKALRSEFGQRTRRAELKR